MFWPGLLDIHVVSSKRITIDRYNQNLEYAISCFDLTYILQSLFIIVMHPTTIITTLFLYRVSLVSSTPLLIPHEERAPTTCRTISRPSKCDWPIILEASKVDRYECGNTSDMDCGTGQLFIDIKPQTCPPSQKGADCKVEWTCCTK